MGFNTYHFWIAKDQNYILTEQEFYLNSEAGYDRPGSPCSYSHISTSTHRYSTPTIFIYFFNASLFVLISFFLEKKINIVSFVLLDVKFPRFEKVIKIKVDTIFEFYENV